MEVEGRAENYAKQEVFNHSKCDFDLLVFCYEKTFESAIFSIE